jgi:GxxExxY protein
MHHYNQELESALATSSIGLAMKIHSRFGPGLLESAYRECLAYELRKAGYRVESEKSLPLVYEEVRISQGYRIDLLVNDKLVIELKSVDALLDVHFAQVMTYLRVGDYRLGLLINFKVAHLRDGIKRVANNL